MSDSNGYAGLAELKQAIERGRHYIDAQVDGLGKVRLQNMSAREHLQIQAPLEKISDPVTRYVQLQRAVISHCWVNGAGDYAIMGNEDLLGDLPAGTLDQLFSHCLDHCGLSQKQVEDTEKNLSKIAAD